ncbi:MAG: aminotransferase class V-fold PLP-dependent enzyme [Alphaproteobacteria bacterium]|jgi:cysteine desulfurase family protein|nr:aminotransferase class V-fold PLP-dependent enzyme [Alphaproteobacteria bacterium]
MKDNYYLDNAATTWPKPEPVYDFMDRFFRSHGVNPGRAGHQLGVEAEAMVVETRALLAAFFGFAGDPARVVFTQNATDSLNTAILGLVGPGDHMIITRLEHNSVLRPANHLERDQGVQVTRIGGDAQGYVDPEEVRAAITPKTRAVVVNHASNVLGAVQDLAAIGAVVADSAAHFVVDTCQTAGVLAIDMGALGIDVLAFTGHKGLFGPMGIGGLIVGEGVEISPARVGGTGIDSISPFQPDDYPHRLEAGTVSIPGIAGLNAAQKWFAELGRAQAASAAETSHGALCRAALAHIHGLECAHIDRLVTAFGELDDVWVYGPKGNRPRAATLAINVDGLPADTAGTMLDADFEVCVRAGLHCAPLVHEDRGTMAQNGAIRISPGYFSDDEDIDRAIEGVAALADYARKRQ